MNLMTVMFNRQPSQRLNLADILGHPWMSEPTASSQDALAEFSSRRAQIEAIREAEKSEREAQRQEREAHAGGGQQLGVMLGSEGETKLLYEPAEGAKLAPYDVQCQKMTQFFSTYSPELAFNDILKSVNDLDGVSDVKIDTANWKVKFTIGVEPEE